MGAVYKARKERHENIIWGTDIAKPKNCIAVTVLVYPLRSLKQVLQLNDHIPEKQDICAPSRDAEGFLWAGFQPTRVQSLQRITRDCRTVPGTANEWWNNLETQQPILWSDEYLPTGGMLIPSVLSQRAHMVPCCRRLQQERLFSRGCLQFIYIVCCTCCMTMQCWKKTDLLSE